MTDNETQIEMAYCLELGSLPYVPYKPTGGTNGTNGTNAEVFGGLVYFRGGFYAHPQLSRLEGQTVRLEYKNGFLSIYDKKGGYVCPAENVWDSPQGKRIIPQGKIKKGIAWFTTRNNGEMDSLGCEQEDWLGCIITKDSNEILYFDENRTEIDLYFNLNSGARDLEIFRFYEVEYKYLGYWATYMRVIV
jgi:hypothetical protein